MDTCDFVFPCDDEDPTLLSATIHLQNLYKVITGLNSDLKECRQKIIDLERDKETMRLENDRVKGDLSMGNFKYEQLKRKYLEMKETIKGLKDNNQLVKEENEKLKEDINQLTLHVQNSSQSLPPKKRALTCSLYNENQATSPPRPEFKDATVQYESPRSEFKDASVQYEPPAMSPPSRPRQSTVLSELNSLDGFKNPNNVLPPVTPPSPLFRVDNRSDAGRRLNAKMSRDSLFQAMNPQPLKETDTRKKLPKPDASKFVEKPVTIGTWLNTGKGTKSSDASKVLSTSKISSLSLGSLTKPGSSTSAEGASTSAGVTSNSKKSSLISTSSGPAPSLDFIPKQTPVPSLGSVQIKKEKTSPRLNLSLTIPGKYKQTSMVGFTKSTTRTDPDETFCADAEADTTFSITPKANKQSNRSVIRTLSAEDLFQDDSMDREDSQQRHKSLGDENDLDLNQGMMIAQIKVEKESNASKKSKKAKASNSSSVLILPTPTASPIIIEDSELVATSQPEEKRDDLSNEFNKENICENTREKNPVLDSDATYCPGFTELENEFISSPIAPKKRSRDAVENEDKNPHNLPNASKDPKTTWVKMTCKDCEDYYNTAFAHDPEYLARRAKICNEKHQRANYEAYETPPGFWDPDFEVEATQKIRERNERQGEMIKEQKKQEARRKK